MKYRAGVVTNVVTGGGAAGSWLFSCVRLYRERVNRATIGLALLVCAGAGCGHQTEPDCVMPPCALPIAIMLRVTSIAGGPVPGLTLTVSGAVSGSGPCTAGPAATSCVLPGTSGTYNLRLTAAGFEEKTLTVTVQGSTPPCGCTTVQTQQLDVALTPN